MREILFKAKRTDGEGWAKGDLQTIYGGVQIANNKGTYDVCPQTVCQYTGLLDASGDMIFEGDISDNALLVHMSRTGKWMARHLDWKEKRNSPFYHLGDLEVMCTITGNIHDQTGEGCDDI